MDIGKIIWFWGCFLSFALDASHGLSDCNSLTLEGRVVYSHCAFTQNSDIQIQSSESWFEIMQANFKDTNSNPKPIFFRCDSIRNFKTEYWDSLFVEAYQNSWIYTDSSGKLIPVPWEIRSRFLIRLETGWIPNSLYESFLGGNDQPFYAVKLSRLSICTQDNKINNFTDSISKTQTLFPPLENDSLTDTVDSIEMLHPLPSLNTNNINTTKTSPKTMNQLRVLLKFDWMSKDTLRNILCISDSNDSLLDLNTVLNYWVGNQAIQNVSVNRNDSFFPKNFRKNNLEDFGYDVFLPEFFIMPLTCFHSPLVIEFWGKNQVTVYRDMDKIEGLTLKDVIPILKSVKKHSELFHSKSCLNTMLKLQLFIKNKNAKGSDFIDFVEDVSELNYLLEVKTN